MRAFQVDRLKCKRELVMMIVQGHTLREMVEFVESHGERCSKSSIDRYLKCRFAEGHIFEDGSLVLTEKEGRQVKVTRYPPHQSANNRINISLSASSRG